MGLLATFLNTLGTFLFFYSFLSCFPFALSGLVYHSCDWTNQQTFTGTITFRCNVDHHSGWVTSKVDDRPMITSTKGSFQFFVLNEGNYTSMLEGKSFHCGWDGCHKLFYSSSFSQSIYYYDLKKTDENYPLLITIKCEEGVTCDLTGNVNFNSKVCSPNTCCFTCGYGVCECDPQAEEKCTCNCGFDSFGKQCTVNFLHDCQCVCQRTDCVNSVMTCDGSLCYPISERSCTTPCAAERCCPTVPQGLCAHSPAYRLPFSSSGDSFFSISSECECDKGWYGSACDIPSCPQSCINGQCVLPEVCECFSGFTGKSCEEYICSPSCVHGKCLSNKTCLCEKGFHGNTCEEMWTCSPGCSQYGICTENNTCLCMSGYFGAQCSISYLGLAEIVVTSLLLLLLFASLIRCIIRYGAFVKKKTRHIELQQPF